jgi:hypothetical protein
MRFKKIRLGLLLTQAATDPAFFSQIHVIFGGSGAVGGATALHLISFFEEAINLSPTPLEHFPRIIITARTKQEIRQFTSLLFHLQERDHNAQPTPLRGVGYRTAKGVIVELHSFTINPALPELEGFALAGPSEREKAVLNFLDLGGLNLNSTVEQKVSLIRKIIEEQLSQPFTEFLISCQERLFASQTVNRFRSVIVSIPLASIASYKLSDFEAACSYLGFEPESQLVKGLKIDYLRSLTNDLSKAAEKLADNVVVAHTTAVGGMYDEDLSGIRNIRLGFAHSAMDKRLVQKQVFAEELARLYAERGIKMLITAAAVGVDTILEHKTPPLNTAIRNQLREAEANGFQVLPTADIRAGMIQVYPPVSLDLLTEEHEPISFSHGHTLILDYALKSGENGFFTVSNAEALYRVMRVTSSTELGLILARTAAFDDDPLYPFFVNNICYYTESDYSRQIFDLLGQPQLRKNQLSGLQPKALQDLGSAKHQGELHMLGLLILLHRLTTLNLEAIPRHVDLTTFNSQEFFENNSQALTLDHVLSWNISSLSTALTRLISATTEAELEPLKHFYQAEPSVQEAIHRVLRAILWASRAVTSLGTPILYEVKGKKHVITGYYTAPIGQILTHRDSLHNYLKREFLKAGGGDQNAFEQFLEFYIASYGFADIRPVAVLVTARSAAEPLSGKVQVFREEKPFLEALQQLKPYTYFATSGLIALLVRLKGLYRLSYELNFKIGAENEFRAHFYYDDSGRSLLVPGLIESLRMTSEGLEKNTGLERIDGRWGYYIKQTERAKE